MNAALGETERIQLVQDLRGVIGALERHDDADFEHRLGQLLRAREEGLFVHVAKLTRELHRALSDMRLDNRLAELAGSEIPDACGRLDYVVQVTERAAHRTLDLVEASRALASDIVSCAGGVTPEGARRAIVLDAEKLRGHLSELAQAQEYQDISGQIIRRVIDLVRNVENALLDLLRVSGSRAQPGAAPRAVAPGSLQGPAVPGTVSGASQQDADELLASLGF